MTIFRITGSGFTGTGGGGNSIGALRDACCGIGSGAGGIGAGSGVGVDRVDETGGVDFVTGFEAAGLEAVLASDARFSGTGAGSGAGV